MYAANGMLFLHLPRTGGTFISQVCERHQLGTRQVLPNATGHEGIRHVPGSVSQGSFIWGCVRDPWSWYRSVDAHYRTKNAFQGFLHEYLGKSVPFRDALQAMTLPGQSPIVRMDKAARAPGDRLPVPTIGHALSTSGLGLYSWMILRMYCRDPVEIQANVQQALGAMDAPWSVNALVDSAQLREGMSQVVSAWRPDLWPQLDPDIRSRQPSNTSGQYSGVLPGGEGPDPRVYTQEMQGWVYQADGWMLRRLGYTVPTLHRPVMQLFR